ncbi:hypothetical protein [Streptomyces pactum]|uniref:Uncharacterized protein n=1 Tax=Streptomyces pactum TaxID=68249 RepID=A0A1S6J7U6_9ACTN|nr:hypothetical protein [Streptomyces pactum]AQS67826.1 hypothetical protein B1H29_13620 [Streptomyces pactum]
MSTPTPPTAPRSAAAPPPAARALTGWSAAGLVLLAPTVVVAWLAVLATERGGRCLTYGEQCSAVPGEALWACLWAAAVLGVLALAWPRARWTSARCGAVVLQWGAQLTLGALILSGA